MRQTSFPLSRETVPEGGPSADAETEGLLLLGPILGAEDVTQLTFGDRPRPTSEIARRDVDLNFRCQEGQVHWLRQPGASDPKIRCGLSLIPVHTSVESPLDETGHGQHGETLVCRLAMKPGVVARCRGEEIHQFRQDPYVRGVDENPELFADI